MILSLNLLFMLVSVVLVVPQSVDAVDYYVTTTEPHTSQDCLAGEICYTLDHYASNVAVYFDGRDNVTMIFLGGIHRSTRCFNITNPAQSLLNITMLRFNETLAEIQLDCDFTLDYINSLAMSDLIIKGNNKFGVILHEAPVKEMMINRMTFVGGALAFDGHLYSTITIMNSNFIASLLEMYFVISGAMVFILQSTFTSGIHQNHMISMCVVRGSVNLFVDSMHTYSQSHFEQSVPQLRYPCRNERLSALVADVAFDFFTGNLEVTIVNSLFSRGYGTAINYQLGTSITGSRLETTITSCTFYGYDHGAVVLKFTELISVYMMIENSIFANNSYTGTDGGASALQIVYPLQGNPPNWLHVLTFQNCVFQNNVDQVVLLYKSINVTFVDCTFEENSGTSIVAFHARHLLFSGTIDFIGNSAYRGAGLVLTESTLYIDFNTSITFYGNKASNKGGAILVEGGETTSGDDPDTTARCFYQILRQDQTQKFSVNFTDNSAVSGGNDIYGSPLASYCVTDDLNSRSNQEVDSNMFLFHPESLSSISSDPKRVCICNESGVPKCDDINYIFLEDYSLFPGEIFYLPVAVVGVEFGTVTGEIQANLIQSDGFVSPEFNSVTEITHCTKLNFSVHHRCAVQVRMYLTIQDRYAPYYNYDVVKEAIKSYSSSNVIPTELLNVPIIIDVSLLPCPAGFMLVGEPPVCDCYPQISAYVVCEILNGTGFVSRKDEVWIGIDSNNNTVFSISCPFEHCNYSSTRVDLMQPDNQCDFHHAGRLCGGCEEGYSLALGSSHCLHCPDNGYLSLILIFIVSGPILVLFIHMLNLTVTQGTLNAIVLYVNIVWTYQQLLFPRRSMLLPPMRIFLAWFNLDFGIESCFVDGLTAFWKTWLQFVFPLYLWSIAGTIIFVCRHSVKWTNVFGERAVPLLATLFLLSYLKILRIILDILVYTTLTEYPSDSNIVVWSLDGNLGYGHYPHIFLLLLAIATLLLLHLPYTVALFSIQWLQRISHLKPFKWVTKFKPVFDATLAPLKHKHHYWFGTLLILRGVLLLTFTLTAAQLPALNLLLLLISMTIFSFYMFHFQLYKSRLILILESLAFLNLVLLAGGALCIMSDSGDSIHKNNMTVLVNISIAAKMIQFFGVTLMHIWKNLKEWCIVKPFVQRLQGYMNIDRLSTCTDNSNDNDVIDNDGGFRESILAYVR